MHLKVLKPEWFIQKRTGLEFLTTEEFLFILIKLKRDLCDAVRGRTATWSFN